MKNLFIKQKKHQERGTLVCLCQMTWALLQCNRNGSSKDQGMCVSGRTSSYFTHFLHLGSFRWVMFQHQQCSSSSFYLPDPQVIKDSCISISVCKMCSTEPAWRWRTMPLLLWSRILHKRTPPQSAQVKRNGPAIQLQHLDGNNDQHRLCFFLTEETKNTHCAGSNWLAKAAVFLRAFYSPGDLLVMFMHSKGSK